MKSSRLTAFAYDTLDGSEPVPRGKILNLCIPSKNLHAYLSNRHGESYDRLNEKIFIVPVGDG